MENSQATVPPPKNEPVLNYAPGSAERQALNLELKRISGLDHDIPVIVNGKEIRTGKVAELRCPHNHALKLGRFHQAGPEEVRAAISGALSAQKEWASMSREDRSAILLKAAELLAGKWRFTLNASTMLGQSKTCHQAEIDAACEMIDFFRFNVSFQESLYSMQPLSAPGQWNRIDYRPLEGFVFAVTPFNFTSIAGNLPTSAALMGNVCLWKPASTAVLSGYYVMKLLEEAGMPPGVIQFLPGSGAEVGNPILSDPNLAGIHFTGSTGVFQSMWQTVGKQIANYRSYPRLVGETGGKDFILAHPSADVAVLRTALVRGAFEYQGQKCSAASRAYIPKSLWQQLRGSLIEEIASLPMGDPADYRNFMGAVIDAKSFSNLKGYIEQAKKDSQCELLVGGTTDDKVGYFISPTVIQAKEPKYRTMCDELFGPVLSVFVYEDSKWDETLQVLDQTSPYALTGAILAQDRQAIRVATNRLVNAAGNLYINNKPTGAVVGQQPFGGARGSGTNDKAGSLFNLLRWVSLRTISETFAPPSSYAYPYMEKN